MIISIDVETGGLGLDKSLLSLAIVPVKDNFDLLEVLPLDIKIKPDDKLYKCTAEALAINKINLVDHDAKAITYKESGTILYKYLEQLYVFNDKEKLIVLGKNVHFDLQFIWEYLIGRATWETFCSYQLLDVSSLWLYLRLIDIVPKLEKTSLSNLASYFGINLTKYNLHTALGDSLLTIEVMKEIMTL